MAFLFLLLCMTMFLQLVVYLVGVRNDVIYKQHTSPLFLRPFWLSISTVNVFQRDSRINITTFFNFPGMFRRYIRHLQCYIFWNRRRIYIKRARSYKVGYIALSILRTKTTTKKIKWVTLHLTFLQRESQVNAFHLLVEIGLKLYLVLGGCRVQDLETIRCAGWLYLSNRKRFPCLHSLI